MSSMEPTEVKKKIYQFLEDNYSYQASEITDTTDLLDGYVIDSLGIIQIVMFLETSFGCEFNANDVNADNFKNINTLSEFVEGQLKNGK
ncbi:MAG: acyl carrier protein [Candidatus Marinimicrobia bacterium]|nr:acyl carrier protein [Candidatus Neomarinimicrobiota bacterium]MBT3632996.1 acyl carrier protein [Candidatus Neomarinimicrobiota bacterium]MBT3682106.1 acyl carrier protein [Candidatus Neomarinimicrobiota bacterium]MBT3760784.1 acyl carrier protein [Candidatus Neomarinimicrobiota bacterium]MBT3895236.1 acyl carrier protein [Candidatus Neomarinimicrobiota bacterium]